MNRWGIEPIDWLATDDVTVNKTEKVQPIPLSVCKKAAIALAFAVFKLRVSCPPSANPPPPKRWTNFSLTVG